MTIFTDVGGLADRVRSDSSIAIGGALFSRLPISLIREVIARRPRRLHYLAWGGGLPLEMFLAAGALSELTFCFSSLDVFGLAPRFRTALESGSVEVHEWTALGMIQGLAAAGQNLPSLPFQTPRGTAVNGRTAVEDPITGDGVSAAPRMDVDVLLLHAQRADAAGNVELQGARGLDLSLVHAARQVLVTVEEVVPVGRLGAPRAVVIGRRFISAVAVAPAGAYPTSCLPYYAADYRAAAALAHDPAASIAHVGGGLSRSRRAARIPPAAITAAFGRLTPSVAASAPPSTAELMMTFLATQYPPASACSAGAVSPLALGSYLLAQHLTSPPPTIITTSGGYWDIGARPLLLGLGEVADFASAPLHMGGDETYHQLYMSGRIDFEVVNVAQIDAHAATNNLWVTSPSGKRIRLPGQGGMADVADMHANFVLYQTRQGPLSLVETLPTVSAARTMHSEHERTAAGYRPGRTLLVTDLAVFEPDPDSGRLRPVSLHPGVDLNHLRQHTGFAFGEAALPTTAEPDARTLQILRDVVDPLNVRELEFVAARDRSSALDRVLTAEEQLTDSLIPT